MEERSGPTSWLLEELNRQNRVMREFMANMTSQLGEFRRERRESQIEPMTESTRRSNPGASGLSSAGELQQENDATANPSMNTTSLTVGVMFTQAVEFPKFKGEAGTAAVQFLERFEGYCRRINLPDSEKLGLVKECLLHLAADWFAMCSADWSSYHEFRESFLEHYWSSGQQEQLRKKIASGKWDGRNLMLEHFASYVQQARALTEPIPESALINELMRHFPVTIQRLWALQPTKTMQEVTRFLRNQDHVNETEESQPDLTKFATQPSNFCKPPQNDAPQGATPPFSKTRIQSMMTTGGDGSGNGHFQPEKQLRRDRHFNPKQRAAKRMVEGDSSVAG